ncbi:hypothetical protein GOV14_03840 [Candidatus Pacearchaeota archaeon]|nr:hypothetical protein [Candidatus Pacearchaeota archaeon]
MSKTKLQKGLEDVSNNYQGKLSIQNSEKLKSVTQKLGNNGYSYQQRLETVENDLKDLIGINDAERGYIKDLLNTTYSHLRETRTVHKNKAIQKTRLERKVKGHTDVAKKLTELKKSYETQTRLPTYNKENVKPQEEHAPELKYVRNTQKEGEAFLNTIERTTEIQKQRRQGTNTYSLPKKQGKNSNKSFLRRAGIAIRDVVIPIAASVAVGLGAWGYKGKLDKKHYDPLIEEQKAKVAAVTTERDTKQTTLDNTLNANKGLTKNLEQVTNERDDFQTELANEIKTRGEPDNIVIDKVTAQVQNDIKQIRKDYETKITNLEEQVKQEKANDEQIRTQATTETVEAIKAIYEPKLEEVALNTAKSIREQNAKEKQEMQKQIASLETHNKTLQKSLESKNVSYIHAQVNDSDVTPGKASGKSNISQAAEFGEQWLDDCDSTADYSVAINNTRPAASQVNIAEEVGPIYLETRDIKDIEEVLKDIDAKKSDDVYANYKFNDYGKFLGQRGKEQWENKDYIQSTLTGVGSWLSLINDSARVVYENGAKALGGVSRTITSNTGSLLTKGKLAEEDTWKKGAQDAKDTSDFFWRNWWVGPNWNKSHAELVEFATLGTIPFDTTNDPYVKDDKLPGYLLQAAADAALIHFMHGGGGDGGGGGGGDQVTGGTSSSIGGTSSGVSGGTGSALGGL